MGIICEQKRSMVVAVEAVIGPPPLGSGKAMETSPKGQQSLGRCTYREVDYIKGNGDEC